MRTHTALAALALLSAVLVHAPLSAQSDASAQLRVRIVDQTRAPLPLARVTIYTLDGNPGITVTADEHGVAFFPTLPSGLTQIHATFPGFSPYIEGTKLHAGKNTATATLQLAPVTEQVFVTASPDSADSGS